MEIFGANLKGIEGELIRFRVLSERQARGVTVLGDARTAVRQGTIERCLSAIRSMEGFEQVGANLRYLIDLAPVQSRVDSPGIDLPLAITLLRATVMQSREDLRTAIEEQESNLAKLQAEVGSRQRTPDRGKAGSKGAEDRKAWRKRYLDAVERLKSELLIAERYHKTLSANQTNFLLIGKLDITTAEIENPRDGMLGLVSAATELGKPITVIVPEDCEVHAAIVSKGAADVTTLKARDLGEVWRIITGQANGRPCRRSVNAIRPKRFESARSAADLKDIEGNARAKMALEICLAGRHSLLMLGPAGQGKTMLAHAATKLLPDLADDELLEVNKVYSARGDLQANELVLARPYQEVSSSITEAALFGSRGAGGNARPGLISAAHRGVLFFDEFNLISPALLDQLRAPWQDGTHAVQRAMFSARFPSRFQFLGAMNPCSCSRRFLFRCSECAQVLFGTQRCPKHPKSARSDECVCTPAQVRSHFGRISAPIRDRIDMLCLVSRHDRDVAWRDDLSTRTVRARIRAAWDIQSARYESTAGLAGRCNGDTANAADLERAGAITAQTRGQLHEILEGKLGIEVDSYRKRDQLLAIARTVADLEGQRAVGKSHLRRAIEASGLMERLLG